MIFFIISPHFHIVLISLIEAFKPKYYSRKAKQMIIIIRKKYRKKNRWERFSVFSLYFLPTFTLLSLPFYASNNYYFFFLVYIRGAHGYPFFIVGCSAIDSFVFFSIYSKGVFVPSRERERERKSGNSQTQFKFVQSAHTLILKYLTFFFPFSPTPQLSVTPLLCIHMHL